MLPSLWRFFSGALSLNPPPVAYSVGIILCMTAGVFWSMVGVVVKSMEEATSWQILFYRSVFLSLSLFLIIAYRWRGRLREAFMQSGWGLVTGSVSLFLAFFGSIFSLVHTTVANAMLVFASAPFLAAVLGWILLREKVRLATWLAIFVAMVGASVMVAGGFAVGHWLGNIAALVSALGFAGFALSLRWKSASDLLPLICAGGILAALVSGIACLVSGEGLAISWHDLALTACLGIVQLTIGMTLFTIGSRALPAAELALVAMSEVVLGPIWAWLFLNETPREATLLGGGLLLSAILYNALTGARRKTA